MLYAALAGKQADARLSMKWLAEKMRPWALEQQQLGSLARDVVLAYSARSGYQMLRTSMASLHAELPSEDRAQLLDDLTEVVMEDGQVTRDDLAFLRDLAAQWDVPAAT